MPAPPAKSVLRSVRLRRSLHETIERDAAAKGISVNSLVSSVLTRYAEWDRFAEKFGFVSITKDGYLAMMEAIPDENLDRLAERTGGQNPRDMTLFWFKRVGIEPFLAYLALISRYGGIVEFEVEREGPNVTLLLQHDLGARHSRYLQRFFGQAIQSVVGVVPRTELGRNSIVFRFRVPAPTAPPPG